MRIRNKNEKAFTFIELSIVLAVLAILVALAVPAYNSIKKESEDSAITTDIGTLSNAFSLASLVNASGLKTEVAPGTTVSALTDINGNIVDPNSIKLYTINSAAANYYKKLSKSIEDYLVDENNNVYYIGKTSRINGGISAKLGVDLNTSVTTKILSGDVLGPRRGHSSLLYNNKMLVFAGRNASNRLNDFYEVDMQTYTVTNIELTGEEIPVRTDHSAVIYNDKMIVFGGYNPDMGETNDCYEIDLKTYSVKRITLSGDTIPTRSDHSAVLYEGKMIIFGGWGGSCLNDIYEVDLNTYEVTQRTLTGDSIPGRAEQSAVLYNGNMIVFGGNDGSTSLNDMYSINLSTYNVVKRNPTGDIPEPTSSASAVVSNGKMIVYAGSVSADYYYSIDLSTFESTRVYITGPTSSRYNHSALMYDGRMVVFGGEDDGTYLNDCFEVH